MPGLPLPFGAASFTFRGELNNTSSRLTSPEVPLLIELGVPQSRHRLLLPTDPAMVSISLILLAEPAMPSAR